MANTVPKGTKVDPWVSWAFKQVARAQNTTEADLLRAFIVRSVNEAGLTVADYLAASSAVYGRSREA